MKEIILIKDLFVLTKAWQEEWERLLSPPPLHHTSHFWGKKKKKLAVAAACHWAIVCARVFVRCQPETIFRVPRRAKHRERPGVKSINQWPDAMYHASKMKIKFKCMRCNFSASELMFTALSYATLKSSAKKPQTQREERNVQGIKQLQSSKNWFESQTFWEINA